MNIKIITKYPPRLSLIEAINVIKKMYQEHSTGEVNISFMPEILNTKKNSSFFFDKISALTKFGLVIKSGDILKLTELAMRIIEPIGDEAGRSKFEAFNKIELLSDLLKKFPSGILPPEGQLQLILKDDFHLPKERLKDWYYFVINSFGAILDMIVKPTQKFVNLANPNVESQFNTGNAESHTIKLPDSKGTFGYSLEDNFTVKDLEFLKDFFELMIKNIKKGSA